MLLGQNASTFKETLKKAEEASTLSPIVDGVYLHFLRFEFLWIGLTSGEFRAYVLTDIPIGQIKKWMEDLESFHGWHMAYGWQTRHPALWQRAQKAVRAAKKKSKSLDAVLDQLTDLKRTQRLLIIKSESESKGLQSAAAGAKNEIAIPIGDFEATLAHLAISAWGYTMMGWLTGEGASAMSMAKERHAFACAMLAVRFDSGIAWQRSSSDKSISILKTDHLRSGSPNTGFGTMFGRPGVPLLSAAGDALYYLIGAIAPHDYSSVRMIMTMRKRGCPWGCMATGLPGETPFLLFQSGLGALVKRIVMIDSRMADPKKSDLIRGLLEKAESPEVAGRIHPVTEVVAAIEHALSPGKLIYPSPVDDLKRQIGFIPGAGAVANARNGSLGECFQDELIGERIPEKVVGGLVSRTALAMLRLAYAALVLLSRRFLRKAEKAIPTSTIERCTALHLAQQGASKLSRLKTKPQPAKTLFPSDGHKFMPFRVLDTANPSEEEPAGSQGICTEMARERLFDFRMFLEKIRLGGLTMEARQSSSFAMSCDLTLFMERDRFLRFPVDDLEPIAPWILIQPKDSPSVERIDLAPMLAMAAASETLRKRLENFRDICSSAKSSQPVLSRLLLESTEVDWDNPLDLLRVFDAATIASAISDDPDFWDPMHPGAVMTRLGITDPHQQRAFFPAAFKNPFGAVCNLFHAAAIALVKSHGNPRGWTQGWVPIWVDRAMFDQMATDQRNNGIRQEVSILPCDKSHSDVPFDETKHSHLIAGGDIDTPEDSLLAYLEGIDNESVRDKREWFRFKIQEFQAKLDLQRFRETVNGFIAENREKVKLTTLLIEILDPTKIPKRRR